MPKGKPCFAPSHPVELCLIFRTLCLFIALPAELSTLRPTKTIYSAKHRLQDPLGVDAVSCCRNCRYELKLCIAQCDQFLGPPCWREETAVDDVLGTEPCTCTIQDSRTALAFASSSDSVPLRVPFVGMRLRVPQSQTPSWSLKCN